MINSFRHQISLIWIFVYDLTFFEISLIYYDIINICLAYFNWLVVFTLCGKYFLTKHDMYCYLIATGNTTDLHIWCGTSIYFGSISAGSNFNLENIYLILVTLS